MRHTRSQSQNPKIFKLQRPKLRNTNDNEANYFENMKNQEQNEIFVNRLIQENNLLKQRLQESENDRLEFTQKLNTLKQEIERLKNTSNHYQFSNELIKTEKDIVTENLTAMIMNQQKIMDRQFLEQGLKQEYSSIQLALINMTTDYEKQQKQIDNIQTKLDVTQQESLYISQVKNELQQDQIKTQITIKETMNKITRDFDTLEAEKERYRTDYLQLLKKFEHLSDIYEKTRNKIKKYRIKNIRFNNSDLKVCKNCSVEYYEYENFNWSCRLHTSEWGGEMWWCCGKNQKDASGCRMQKHVTKDDDDDEDQQDKQEIEKEKLQAYKCPSCKTIGHRIQQCPKDPNFRTNFNIEEENQRLESLKKSKKQLNKNYQTIQRQIGEFYEEKQFTRINLFVNENYNSELDEEEINLSEFDDSLKDEGELFQDEFKKELLNWQKTLQSAYIKKQIGFQDIIQDQEDLFQDEKTLIPIETIGLKENDKVEKQKSKIKLSKEFRQQSKEISFKESEETTSEQEKTSHISEEQVSYESDFSSTSQKGRRKSVQNKTVLNKKKITIVQKFERQLVVRDKRMTIFTQKLKNKQLEEFAEDSLFCEQKSDLQVVQEEQTEF